MKVSIKKLLASLLAVAMLANLAPVVFAAGATETSVTVGEGGSASESGIGDSWRWKGTTLFTSMGSLGGKSADDVAQAYNYNWNGATALSGDVRYGYTLQDLTSSDVRTYEANMYVSGGAIGGIGFGQGYVAINVDGSGNVTYGLGGSGPAKVKPNSWNRIAVTVTTLHTYVYLNGIQVIHKTQGNFHTTYKGLNFCIKSGSTEGIVAFDDVVVYNESYVEHGNSDDVLSPAESDEITIDTVNEKILYSGTITDISVLSTAIYSTSSNISEVKLFNDDLSEEATNFADANVVLIKTAGNAYYYYTLEKKVLTNAEKMSIVSPKLTQDAASSYKDRIRILNDSIAVFSHTKKSAGYISSDNLIESLVSDNGYSLSYVFEEGGEDANVESVIGGYIKATKDGADEIYIPIIKQTNTKVLNMSAAGSAGSYDISNNGYGATKVTKGGIAGKASDDNAYGFAPNASTSYPSNGYRYNLNGHYDADAGAHKSSENTTFTYVFNAYADGNSVFAIYNGSSVYMKWTSDGNIFFVSDVNDAMSSTPALTNVTRGQWHQFAITVESFSGRAILYVDGQAITNTSLQTPYGKYNAIGFGIDSYNSGSTTGNVLMDDVVYYEGFYYSDGEIVTAESSTLDFTIDTNAKTIYYQNMDLAALKAAVLANTDASAVKVYTDATIATEAGALTASSVVMTTSANGMRYEYYTLKPYSEIPAPVLTITPSVSTYTVSTKYITDLTGYTLYVASYTSDNTLVRVTAYPVEADDLYKNLEFKLAYGDGGTKVKAFLWDDENTPLSFAEYNPGA